MNKKILRYLAIFIVAATITLSCVAAATLAEQDFDGHFKANVPKDAEFDPYEENTTTIYMDSSDNLYLIYSEDSLINDDTIDAFYQGFTQDGTFEKTGTDGDLTLFKIPEGNMGKVAAGVNTDGKVVIVCGDNLKEVKEIANSVDFE